MIVATYTFYTAYNTRVVTQTVNNMYLWCAPSKEQKLQKCHRERTWVERPGGSGTILLTHC